MKTAGLPRSFEMRSAMPGKNRSSGPIFETIPVQASTSFRRASALADAGRKRYRTPRGVCAANPRVAAFSLISHRLIQLRKRVSIQVSEAF